MESTKHLNRQAKYLLNLPDPRGLIPALVSFAGGRSETLDYDSSFEMDLRWNLQNVHSPTIIPMMLPVSRAISTLLQFTCIIPMRTGEIQQGKIQKIVLCFPTTSFMKKRLISLRITKSCWHITDPVESKLSLHFPVYFICLNAIVPLERKIIIQI